jgi:hypothetical protein
LFSFHKLAGSRKQPRVDRAIFIGSMLRAILSVGGVVDGVRMHRVKFFPTATGNRDAHFWLRRIKTTPPAHTESS